MANIIPFSHFVNVTSTGLSSTFTFSRLNALVIGTPTVLQQEYNSVLSLQSVASQYGTGSAEYEYAKTFFSYVSKNATTPEKLTFYNYQPNGQAAAIKGAKVELEKIKKNGEFKVNYNGNEITILVDFSNAQSNTEIANILENVVNQYDLECSFNAVTGGFVIASKEKGANQSLSLATTGLADDLGLSESSGAQLIKGKDAQTLEDALNDIANDNGDYVSLSVLGELTDEEIKIASEFTNASQGRFCFIATSDNINLTRNIKINEELQGNDGFILCYSKNKTYQINSFVQAIIAAIDFDNINGAINCNFIPAEGFKEEAVGTAEELEALNENRVNCIYNMGGYGQNQLLFGEGNIYGSIFHDITGYVGNTWLKAQLEIAGCNMFVSTPLIPLRGSSTGMVLTVLTTPIERAKVGGIIEAVGIGGLTTNERINVITATGENTAVDAIEQNGYYIKPLDLSEDDIKKKRRRILVLYTRNIPTNRVVVQNYVIGA